MSCARRARVVDIEVSTWFRSISAWVCREVAGLSRRVCPCCFCSPLCSLVFTLLPSLLAHSLVALLTEIIVDPSKIGDLEEVEAVERLLDHVLSILPSFRWSFC